MSLSVLFHVNVFYSDSPGTNPRELRTFLLAAASLLPDEGRNYIYRQWVYILLAIMLCLIPFRRINTCAAYQSTFYYSLKNSFIEFHSIYVSTPTVYV